MVVPSCTMLYQCFQSFLDSRDWQTLINWMFIEFHWCMSMIVHVHSIPHVQIRENVSAETFTHTIQWSTRRGSTCPVDLIFLLKKWMHSCAPSKVVGNLDPIWPHHSPSPDLDHCHLSCPSHSMAFCRCSNVTCRDFHRHELKGLWIKGVSLLSSTEVFVDDSAT